MSTYAAFLDSKSQSAEMAGFEPTFIPSWLFDFQCNLVDWAIRKGRAAIFADCGLGKTPMQLVWAQNVVEHANKPVLILTPLAVGPQTVGEGAKFGIDCERSRDGRRASRARIVVTNYEKLHLFDPNAFAGVVCDESSILKHFSGATQKAVTRFMQKLPYRLLCTATAAPNDYIELGTSSEALGALGYSDMLSRFFKQDDNKPHRLEDIKRWRKDQMAVQEHNPNHFGKLSFRVSQQIGQWKLKRHAVTPFWRWVASWARACRKPSDLGFEDASFVLPPLNEYEHVVVPKTPANGALFTIPAVGLREERDERRRTVKERCELVAKLVSEHTYSMIWCQLNIEGDELERIIPCSIQVAGADSEDYKEDAAEWFKGNLCICNLPAFRAKSEMTRNASSASPCICGHKGGPRRLISKSKIFGFGLNLQFCSHVVTFATHSYEQYYQSVRRCWRFGQTQPVTVDVISTEGEQNVRASMARKSELADAMFAELVSHMNDALHLSRVRDSGASIGVPTWV